MNGRETFEKFQNFTLRPRHLLLYPDLIVSGAMAGFMATTDSLIFSVMFTILTAVYERLF